jgi:hypothetical protein
MKTLIILICLGLFLNASKAQLFEIPIPSGISLYSGASTEQSGSITIWVCGANGSVYRGHVFFLNLYWTSAVGNLPNTINLVTMAAIDSLTAFVAGNIGTTGYIYKTTNGGINWTQQFSQSNGRINAIWMRNASTGFVEGNPAGGRWSLWRTTTGGTSWDSSGRYLSALSTDSGYNNSLWCIGDTILFGTNSSKIYFSSNYGINWITEPTSPEISIYSIYWDFIPYPSGQQMFAGTSGSILKSSNFGINWSIQQNVPGTGYILGICSFSPGVNRLTDMNEIYSRSNKIYIGYQGTNWGLWYTAPAGNYTFLFQKRNEPPPSDQYSAPVVGVRDNGGVSICFGCRWGGIKLINSEVPSSYSLSQNYPNPFNPSTSIKYQIAKFGEVQLKIFDMLGKEIATLVNEKLSLGTYEVDWDASNYPSGVYFYKLIVSDPETSSGSSFTESKRMVLIK